MLRASTQPFQFLCLLSCVTVRRRAHTKGLVPEHTTQTPHQGDNIFPLLLQVYPPCKTSIWLQQLSRARRTERNILKPSSPDPRAQNPESLNPPPQNPPCNSASRVRSTLTGVISTHSYMNTITLSLTPCTNSRPNPPEPWRPLPEIDLWRQRWLGGS